MYYRSKKTNKGILSIAVLLTIALITGIAWQASFQASQVHAQDVGCISENLADYIRAVFDEFGTEGYDHIRFLSPAFNMTSAHFPGFANSLDAQLGPQYSLHSFHAVAGNAYNTTWGSISDFMAVARNTAIGNEDILLTEIGWYPHETNRDLDLLRQEISGFSGNGIIGGLIFNVFNHNPAFAAQSMNNTDIQYVCSGDCYGAGVGANSAHYYWNPSLYSRAISNNMRYTLEIGTTNNGSVTSAVLSGISAAHSGGMIPIVRLGVGDNSGGFYPVENLISFIRNLHQQVHSGTVYVIIGPNEPLSECWATPMCECGGSLLHPGFFSEYPVAVGDKEFCEGSMSPRPGGNYDLDTYDPDCPGKAVYPFIFTDYYGPDPIPDPGTIPPGSPQLHECISFTKITDDHCIEESETDKTVSYTITVQNDCEDDLSNLELTDDNVGSIAIPSDLAAGDSFEHTYELTLTTTTQNTVTLIGERPSEGSFDINTSTTVRIQEDCSYCFYPGVTKYTQCAEEYDCGGNKDCSLAPPEPPLYCDIPQDRWCHVTSAAMLFAYKGGSANCSSDPESCGQSSGCDALYNQSGTVDPRHVWEYSISQCGTYTMYAISTCAGPHFIGESLLEVSIGGTNPTMESYMEELNSYLCLYGPVSSIGRGSPRHWLVVTGMTESEVFIHNPTYCLARTLTWAEYWNWVDSYIDPSFPSLKYDIWHYENTL
ncbi:hypothetical protein KJ596_01430 [Patescibacteria group bacterium]|nr:hypothetical protein [Patescibacteria group bacterium]MBU1868407.1 hypothetical protein [Patescibacteria group bacterium]